ncbi:MAG: PEP-CTERM sorting domain-containing protein [Sneathiella sp.]
MIKKLLLASTAVLLLSIASFAAHAATFDFTTPNRILATSFAMEEDGILLTVTAAYFNNDGTAHDGSPQVITDSNGLGVTNHWEDDEITGGHNYNDLAIFEFSEEVKLESVTFSNWDNNDEFTLFVGDLSTFLGTGFEEDHNFSENNYVNMIFGIGAFDGGWFGDNFMIKSMSVSSISAVPLPSSVILFGGALVGLGWISRRKMKLGKSALNA